LVRSYIGWIAIEALSHLEDASSVSELFPEVFGYLWNSVNADAVKVICLNDILHPVFEIASDIVIALVQIGKTGKTAVFYRVLIIPIDVAIRMIMRTLVEWVDLAKVVSNRRDVICNNVNHHPDAFVVGSFDEILEVV